MSKKLPFRFINKEEKLLLYIPDIRINEDLKTKYRKVKIYTRWLPEPVLNVFTRSAINKEVLLRPMIKALESTYRSWGSLNDIKNTFTIAKCFMLYYLNPLTNSRDDMHRAIYSVIDSLRVSTIRRRHPPLLNLKIDDGDIKLMLNQFGSNWWARKDLFGTRFRRYKKLVSHLRWTVMTLQDFVTKLQNYRLRPNYKDGVWYSTILQRLFHNLDSTELAVCITEGTEDEYQQGLFIYDHPYKNKPINLHTKAISFIRPMEGLWEITYGDLIMLNAYSDELRAAIDSIFFEARILGMLKGYINYLSKTVVHF